MSDKLENDESILPDVSKVEITNMMDKMTAVGLGHSACELIKDGEKKEDCRQLLEPLDKGIGDPIEGLSNLQMAHPEEFDRVTDYINSVIMRATELSEKKLEEIQPKNAA